MEEKTIDYVPISKLSRGYAGRIIDQMKENDSLIFVLRNNSPDAVIMSMGSFRKLIETKNKKTRETKDSTIDSLAGSLHQYADASGIGEEKAFYIKKLIERHE